MDITELIYTIMNKPYFKVYVKSHGRIVKTFTQVAGESTDGRAFFLVCDSLKCTWWKPFNPVVDGLKFITYVDLANAIPLKFEKETKYVSTDYVTREIQTIVISEDLEKQKKHKKESGKEHDGLPDKLVEIHHPPDMLYEVVEAHFVKKILTPPENKMDLFKSKWILILVLAAIAFWWISNNGGKII